MANPNTLDITGYDIFVGDLDCGSVSDPNTWAIIDMWNVNSIARRQINLGSIDIDLGNIP